MASKRARWKSDHFRLFLSHTGRFKNHASELRDSLLLYGVDSFAAGAGVSGKHRKGYSEP